KHYVLPGLRALPSRASGLRRSVAFTYGVRSQEAPTGSFVLQVFRCERVAERIARIVDREHIIRSSSPNATAGAKARDGHITVARQVANELNPARLARRIQNLLHKPIRGQRYLRTYLRSRSIREMGADGWQGNAGHAMK